MPLQLQNTAADQIRDGGDNSEPQHQDDDSATIRGQASQST